MSYNPDKYTKVETPVNTEEQKKKRRKKNLMGLGIIIAVILGLTAVGVFGIHAFGRISFGDNGVHEKSWSSGKDNIAIIQVKGTIQKVGDFYDQKWIEGTIRTAANDRDNKGILLVIDSPGGTVYESDATWLALENYKKKTGRPIYAYCESLCASGGYYIASAADKIYGNRNGLVGSIGVIGGNFIDATEALQKLGIKSNTIHTGKNKLMGHFMVKPTQEQIDIMQSISDEAYEQFVGVVAKGRHKTPEQIKPLADGRIYSATQAKKNGLIDGVMTYDECKEMIQKKFDSDVKFVDKTYEKEKGFFDQLKFFESKIAPLGKSELSRTIDTLKSMHQTEPMYLYEG